MKYKISEEATVDFGQMEPSFFLIGILNEFINRYQTVADTFFEEISWKQCFVLICMKFFEQPPTLKELSEVMGCSHQNVKQMLIKLEKAGYVKLVPDLLDKRKQRIVTTDKTRKFDEKNEQGSAVVVGQLFEGIDPKDLQITIKTILQLDEKLKTMKISAIKENLKEGKEQ